MAVTGSSRPAGHDAPIRVLGICGSAARSGRTRALIELVLEGARAAAPQAGTDLLDLADTQVEFADGRPVDRYDAATRDALERVAAADAFVLGSPMYRGGITGALKNLLDLVPVESMRGKAAALVATGGSLHHYLGVDLGLRTALAFFQTHVVPAPLYGATFKLGPDGRPDDPALVDQALRLGADLVLLAGRMRGQALGPAVF
jgi:NAD(P)H-dependent FMN reductase